MNGGAAQAARVLQSVMPSPLKGIPMDEETMRAAIRNWLWDRQKQKSMGYKVTVQLPAMSGEEARQARSILHELYWGAAIWKEELKAGKEEITRAAQMYFDEGRVGYKAKATGRGSPNHTRNQLIDRDGLDCWLCGEHMPEDDRTIEHRQPRSLKGSNDLANLVLCHRQCNQLLDNRPVEEKDRLRDEVRAKL